MTDTPLMTVSRDGFDLFRKCCLLAEQAEHPEVKAALRERARDAEAIGVLAWHAAVMLMKGRKP